MERIVRCRVLPDFVLEVEFDDGTKGAVALKDRLTGPMFEPLRDPARFAEARVDEFGAIAWPNGADLAPDAIYTNLKNRQDLPAQVA